MSNNEDEKLAKFLFSGLVDSPARLELPANFAVNTARLAIVEARQKRAAVFRSAQAEYLGMQLSFAAALIVTLFTLPQLSENYVTDIYQMLSTEEGISAQPDEMDLETIEADLEDSLWDPTAN